MNCPAYSGIHVETDHQTNGCANGHQQKKAYPASQLRICQDPGDSELSQFAVFLRGSAHFKAFLCITSAVIGRDPNGGVVHRSTDV